MNDQGKGEREWRVTDGVALVEPRGGERFYSAHIRGSEEIANGARILEAAPVEAEREKLKDLLIRVEKEVDPRSMLNIEVEEAIERLGGRGGSE